MSSDYRILCLSHDPAIPVEGAEWRSAAEALAAVAERAANPLDTHADCDLVVGRYSYPLIEVACPPQRQNGRHVGAHGGVEWMDAGFLRLLALSTPAQRSAARRTGCWTFDSAHRLRYELGLEPNRG